MRSVKFSQAYNLQIAERFFCAKKCLLMYPTFMRATLTEQDFTVLVYRFLQILSCIFLLIMYFCATYLQSAAA